MPYQPFVDLRLRLNGHEPVDAYRRALDLDQAVASVQYELDGVTYRREVFSSYPDQVLVVRPRVKACCWRWYRNRIRKEPFRSWTSAIVRCPARVQREPTTLPECCQIE